MGKIYFPLHTFQPDVLRVCTFTVTKANTEIFSETKSDRYWLIHQPGLFFQKMDNAIHLINHYPADKHYQNQLSYPVDYDLYYYII